MRSSKHDGSIDTFHQSIREWLDARQQMMMAFSDLCLLKPFDQYDKADLSEAIESFCTELIDYLSFGQFRVFDHVTMVIHPNTHDGRMIKILLGKIFSSTVMSIEFHDLYMKNPFKNLEKDLAKLGEHLAQRLDWEDQLLDMIYDHLLKDHDKKPTKFG